MKKVKKVYYLKTDDFSNAFICYDMLDSVCLKEEPSHATIDKRGFFDGPPRGMKMLRIFRPRAKGAQTSALKTVHWTVFFTRLTRSGFESL